MKVLISGASGLVGTALGARLEAGGHEVLRLVRRSPAGSGEVSWDPADPVGGGPDLSNIAVDAVVHLAGENIAEGRWTDAKRARIRESRAVGTRLVAEALARAASRPSVLVSASAVGYYGDRGEEVLDERSAPGTGFLPEVCAAWEAATQPARDAGVRVVNLRLGVVLDAQGGALAKMLLPFKLGLGGRVGSGRQFMSWITLADVTRAIVFAIENDTLAGPTNAVAPEPVTNGAFTSALGSALGRPTLFPMPAFAARLAFGPMADDLLLGSVRVLPQALLDAGFAFEDPSIGAALRRLLGRPAA